MTCPSCPAGGSPHIAHGTAQGNDQLLPRLIFELDAAGRVEVAHGRAARWRGRRRRGWRAGGDGGRRREGTTQYRQTRRYQKGGGVEAKGKKRRVNTQQTARIGMELYEWLVARGRERWNKKGEG